MRKAQRGFARHSHGDGGGLPRDDPQPGQEVGDALLDFPYEGSPLDALKSVSKVDREDTKVGL